MDDLRRICWFKDAWVLGNITVVVELHFGLLTNRDEEGVGGTPAVCEVLVGLMVTHFNESYICDPSPMCRIIYDGTKLHNHS